MQYEQRTSADSFWVTLIAENMTMSTLPRGKTVVTPQLLELRQQTLHDVTTPSLIHTKAKPEAPDLIQAESSRLAFGVNLE